MLKNDSNVSDCNAYKVNNISSPVKSCPLCHLTPFLTSKTHNLPSGETSHPVTKEGAGFKSLSYVIALSYIKPKKFNTSLDLVRRGLNESSEVKGTLSSPP